MENEWLLSLKVRLHYMIFCFLANFVTKSPRVTLNPNDTSVSFYVCDAVSRSDVCIQY